MEANTDFAVPSVSSRQQVRSQTGLLCERHAYHMNQSTQYTFMLRDIISKRAKGRETFCLVSVLKKMPPNLPKSSASIFLIVLPW